MNQEGKKKADMKKQIQLLKQKYLNKVNSPRNEKKEAEVKQSISQSIEEEKASQQRGEIEREGNSQIGQVKEKDTIKDSVMLLKIFDKEKVSSKKQECKQIGQHVYDKDPFKLGLYDLSMIPSGNKENESKSQQNIEESKEDKEEQERIPNLSQKQLCLKWLSNAQEGVRYIYRVGENEGSGPQLRSKNRLFPGLMQEMVRAFVLNSNQSLSQEQKQVIYRVGLEYFSPSPKFLSDIVLICLVKIGHKYCSIYYEQIIKNVEYYSQKIFKHKSYFSKEELTEFLTNLLKENSIAQENDKLVCILGLQPDLNVIHQALITQNIGDKKLLLSILCMLKPNINFPLSLLYLKCLNQLIPFFKQIGVLQKVIHHFKEIKIPEQLYQSAKSLKLKLITAADDKGEKKESEDLQGGFMGYFNKTVTKIKGKNDKMNE